MKDNRKRSRMAWVMWLLLIVPYMFNTFHAQAMGVIRQSLMTEFSLSENSFVLLTNMFSYAYMVMQIPAGVLLDKFGAKRISVVGALVCALGTGLFSLGQSYGVLLAARILIGLGCSVSFLSVLKISSNWFDDRLFCTMSGVTCFVGMMGAVAAQAPMAALAEIWPWQTIYRALFLFILFVTVLIFLFVRDTPEELGYDPPHASAADTEKGFRTIPAVTAVLKNRYTWAPFLSYGCFYGTYVLIAGIYGPDMFRSFYDVSAVRAASVISFAALGCAVGSVIVDLIADRMQLRRLPHLLFGGLYLALWVLLYVFLGKGPFGIFYPLIFLLGTASTAYAVCWSAVKEVNDPRTVGISTAVANMGGYLGSIAVPTAAGYMYSFGSRSGESGAYRSMLLCGILLTAAGLAAAGFIKETHGKNIYRTER